jgi:DNA polymerase III subunit gamma/tau
LGAIEHEVQFGLTGLLALRRGQSGQVRKEAATAKCFECRGQGSSTRRFVLRKKAIPMSSQVLARKWRPRSFSTLVGQDHVVRALSHALDTQRLHHAYLFTGTRGVGKTTIARIVAKALNCETGVSSSPCGVCTACTEVDSGRYPDYIEMDAASNRGVAEMTQILDAAVYAPSAGRYKVYVIDEVHMLTNTAFNAMLKTLEEPPPHIVFILATTDPQKVPVTVLSRCLQFSLKNMPQPAIVDHAAHVLEQENIPFDKAALQLIARCANGSMRDALSLLDQAIAYGGGQVQRESVAQMLGAIDSHDLYHLLGNVLAGNTAELIAQGDAMQANGVALDNVLADFSTLIHRVALAQVIEPSDDGQFESQQLVALATQATPTALQALYQIAIFGQRDLPLAPDPLSGFTMCLLRMVAFTPAGTASVAGKPIDATPQTPVKVAQALLAPKLTPSATLKVAAAPTVAITADLVTANLAPPVAIPLIAPAPAVKPVITALVDSVELKPDVEPRLDTDPKLDVEPKPVVEVNSLAEAKPVVENKPSATLGFDGDWPKLAAAIPLSGVARQLATTSEMLSIQGDAFELRVALKILADAANVTRLRDALSEHFGRPVRLIVQVGPVIGQTADSVRKIHQEKRLKEANAALQADPVVQSMIKEFGASIVPGSVKAQD